jgi:hypothetical protein
MIWVCTPARCRETPVRLGALLCATALAQVLPRLSACRLARAHLQATASSSPLGTPLSRFSLNLGARRLCSVASPVQLLPSFAPWYLRLKSASPPTVYLCHGVVSWVLLVSPAKGLASVMTTARHKCGSWRARSGGAQLFTTPPAWLLLSSPPVVLRSRACFGLSRTRCYRPRPRRPRRLRRRTCRPGSWRAACGARGCARCCASTPLTGVTLLSELGDGACYAVRACPAKLALRAPLLRHLQTPPHPPARRVPNGVRAVHDLPPAFCAHRALAPGVRRGRQEDHQVTRSPTWSAIPSPRANHVCHDSDWSASLCRWRCHRPWW